MFELLQTDARIPDLPDLTEHSNTRDCNPEPCKKHGSLNAPEPSDSFPARNLLILGVRHAAQCANVELSLEVLDGMRQLLCIRTKRGVANKCLDSRVEGCG